MNTKHKNSFLKKIKVFYFFLEYVILFMAGIVCICTTYVIFIVNPTNMILEQVSIE